MFSGTINGVVGTSYTSEDSDLVAVENNYAAMENELQAEIDNIERTHPGYDEYRYDLDTIGHNPHELASYLTALLQSYTPQSAQAEIERIFGLQYTLTLTEEVEIRYRTETSTDPETGETTSEEVPYEYYILNVELTNKPISSLAEELLTPEQLEMFRVYMETSGNKPLIFGGGSPDTSASEDLSGVQFVNGTRPGNTALVDLAKQQVGNVGGYPYWSWYGFNSRVEWCACFVSWCYNRVGVSEPKFAACQSQGVPWFQSRGQWGARGYENIAPGDAIFFDWDLDGSADHVGIVIGTDGSRVYTVEGNSGDACKIKSYDLNYQCIKGYGADELVNRPNRYTYKEKFYMAINKIERIDREIQKIHEKITEYQNKLKGLEAQKTEAENLQIVQLVRAMKLTPQELNAMLSGGGIPGMEPAPDYDAGEAADYDEGQEDFAHEEIKSHGH